MTTNNATMTEGYVMTNYKRLRPNWIYKGGDSLLDFYRELSDEQKEDILYFHRAAKTLHRLAENDCNGHPREVVEYKGQCNGCARMLRQRSRICSFCGDRLLVNEMFRFNVEDEDWTKRDEKKEANTWKRLQAIADRNNWTLYKTDSLSGLGLKIGDRDMTYFIFLE